MFDRVSDSTAKLSNCQTVKLSNKWQPFTGYFDVNKMFINTIWKLFNVNNTRRTCVTSVRVESIKTARTNYEF